MGAAAFFVQKRKIKAIARDLKLAAGHLMPPQALVPGDDAEVLSGPFAQFVATVESLAPQRWVWVLLDILGSQTRVSLEVGQVKAT